MGELEIGHPVAEGFSLNGAVLSRWFASRHNDGFMITLWLIIGDTTERFVLTNETQQWFPSFIDIRINIISWRKILYNLMLIFIEI